MRAEYRKYNSLAIVSQIVEYLYTDFDLKSVQQLQKMPWVQLLLVKWVLTDDSYNSTKTAPSSKQLYKIMNLAWKLSGKTRLPSEFPDSSFFMRSIAFQQIVYQEPMGLTHIARTKLLFLNLPDDHRLKRGFAQNAGIEIVDFLELSFVLLARFLEPKSANVARTFFSPLEEHFAPGTIDSFLATISSDLRTLRRHLKEESPPSRRPTEYAELSPLHRYPLFRSENEFFCWYPTVLFRCLETFVYDYLRSIDPAWFMDAFGEIFERYVETGIQQSGARYLNEDQLERALPPGKLVDFLIFEDDAVIFVDAKGVGLPEDVKTTHNPKLLRDRTKPTVIKAIEQAYAVFARLAQADGSLPEDCSTATPYLLVVTYKEHFLGNGDKLYQSIAKNDIDMIRANYPNVEIPNENIYFLTIEDFDRLAQGVKDKAVTYTSALQNARQADQDPTTSKFIFSDHLDAMNIVSKPDWLKESADDLTGRILEIMAEQQ